MIQEPDINASSNTSSRLIHKAGLYHPEGKCGIKNHIDQVGFKSCQNGSGILYMDERALLGVASLIYPYIGKRERALQCSCKSHLFRYAERALDDDDDDDDDLRNRASPSLR